MKNKTIFFTLAVIFFVTHEIHAASLSQTFRVSVTIPEHTVIPREEQTSLFNLKHNQTTPDFQLVQVHRDGQEIILKTFIIR